MSSNDIEYYLARAIAERERAASADSENIAQIHLDLAEKYEALAREVDANQRPDWDGSEMGQPA